MNIPRLPFIRPMLLSGAPAQARPAPAKIAVEVKHVTHLQPIPVRYAYCMPDGKGKTTSGGNLNPEIRWSGAPQGTQSFALIMVDRDVPKTFELANQEGKTIPKDFPRRDFYHWVLVDISPRTTVISEGEASRGPGVKPPGKTDYGLTGHNDYSAQNGGYDGCCPPWNDERLHHYYFIVYALDVPSLGLSGSFGGKEAEAAMAGHILGKGEVVGTYTNRLKA